MELAAVAAATALPVRLCAVTFEVQAEVPIGETVCISGDLPELGSFQVPHAREMTTDPKTYPIWKLTLMLPRNTKLSYRYLTTGFKRMIEWERNKSQRTIVVSDDDEEQIVEDQFGVEPGSTGANSATPPNNASTSSIGTGSTATPLEESFDQTPELSQNELVLIAFHLPIRLYLRSAENELWEAVWDRDNPAAKSEDSVANLLQVTWIGAITPTIVYDLPAGEDLFAPTAKRVEGITAACKLLNCVPLFLTKALYDLAYVKFCKEVLWDVFHNVLVPKVIASDEGSFENGYVVVNQAFADLAKQKLKGTEIVWVHDYHLMMLSQMLVGNGHQGPIIFFLHMPFPTSEIFRVLPMKHRLLEGILSASTVGFHTFNHGRHFLTCCRRFLGAQSRSYGNSGALAVEHRDRRVLITISHLGVDSERIRNQVALPTTALESERILQEFKHSKQLLPAKIVFGSLDDLQRLKGIYLKLLAFERFLEQFIKWQLGSARFILWTVSGGVRKQDCEISTDEVRKLVLRINNKYGPLVVHREFESHNAPSFEERIAFWLAVDVLVSTAVSEGLNLFPLEYTLCKREKPGVVILSEFSASAFILNGAVRVNCYDIADIADRMDETARMSSKEKQARFARDVENISTMSTSRWAKHVISEVVTVLEDSNFLTIEPVLTSAHGNHSLMQFVHVKSLKHDDVVRASGGAQRRMFFFDFGGTLVPREETHLTFKKDFLSGLGVKLSEQLLNTLTSLCQDENNLVFIVSGDARTVLTRVFYPLLSNSLGLIAHSGLCIRFPTAASGETSREQELAEALQRRRRHLTMWDEKHEGEVVDNTAVPFDAAVEQEWRMTVDVTDYWRSWMQDSGILALIKQYTWITVGSVYYCNAITTTWDYTLSDPEFGLFQAQSLILELEQLISKANLNVMVKHSKNTLQLLPSGVDKGFGLRKIFSVLKTLKPQWNGLPPDFCLAIGDDTTDEMMFGAVHQYFTSLAAHSNSASMEDFSNLAGCVTATAAPQVANAAQISSELPKMFTVTVGRKPTTASYYVRDTETVTELLGKIVDGNKV